jgi:hypothetical protein
VAFSQFREAVGKLVCGTPPEFVDPIGSMSDAFVPGFQHLGFLALNPVALLLGKQLRMPA